MSVEKFKEEPLKFLKTTKKSELINLKKLLDDAYYNTEEPLVDDFLYDMLKDYLLQKGEILQVGYEIKTDNRIKLPYYLGSADKITPKDISKYNSWISKNNADTYVISSKLDGVSCLLIYEHKKNIIKLYSRGDGIIGGDISKIVPFIKLPTKFNKNTNTDIAVRGELIINREIFNEKYKKEYKNPRNMVSGIVGAKTIRTGLRDVEFIPYEIITEKIEPSPEEQLKELQKMGFNSIKHIIIEKKLLSLKNLEKILEKFKKESLYDIDGIIVQSNKSYERNTDGNPDYFFAFKAGFTIFTTSVKYVEWNVSKRGKIIPVVHIVPVDTGDVIIKKATAHNASFIVSNKIGKDAIIKIMRSNDVIPYIVEVVKGTKVEMPKILYKWDDNNVNIYAIDKGSDLCIKLLTYFFETMKIKHISEQTIRKLYEVGYTNLFSILSAKESDIANIEGLGNVSAKRMRESIDKSLNNMEITTLLSASGLFGEGIGKRKLQAIEEVYPNFFTKEIANLPFGERMGLLNSVEGFSTITSEKVASALPIAIIFLSRMAKYGTFKEKQNNNNNLLEKYNIVFSGFRDNELEERLKNLGAIVSSSVSKKVNLLLVASLGDNTGKVQKAKEYNIKIRQKDEFIKEFLND